MRAIRVGEALIPVHRLPELGCPPESAPGVAADQTAAVLLDTRMTPALWLEGIANDIARRINATRAAMKMDPTYRADCLIGVTAWSEWWAVRAFRADIRAATRCWRLRAMMANEAGEQLT